MTELMVFFEAGLLRLVSRAGLRLTLGFFRRIMGLKRDCDRVVLIY